jgi:proliferating cell nuclear antigen
MVSDHIGIQMVEEDGRLSIDAEGDTDNVRLDLQDDDLQSVTLADARSVFSLDYLKDLVRTMPRGVDVSLRFGSDFPLIIDYEIADGDGHVTRMLAPRIQTD